MQCPRLLAHQSRSAATLEPPVAAAGARRPAPAPGASEKATKKSKSDEGDPLAEREFILVVSLTDAAAACKRLMKETIIAVDCEGVKLSRCAPHPSSIWDP